MKKITIIAAVVMTAFTTNSFAQQESSASVTSDASIVTPIAVTAGTPLNFGTIAKGTLESVVTIDKNGITVTSGDAELVSTNGAPATAATFNVTGEGGYGFNITSPTSIELTGPDDGTNTATSHKMTVATTIASTGTLSTAGAATIDVTAALTVKASQASGAYTNANGLLVTISYN